MRLNTHKLLVSLPVTAMTLALLLLPAPSHAQGIEPSPFAPFGMIGLGRLQTARLNVANLQSTDVVPATPCRVMLSFADSEGMPFLTSSLAPIMEEVSLMPGKAAFLDLGSREAFPRDNRELRMQIRGTVGSTPPDDITPDPCESLVATMEIFDNLTGRTAVIYALPQVGVTPPDDTMPPRGE